MSYSNINNPVNYQLQGFGQNGVRTISIDQLYIQGEYYRVLVAEEDSYVTAVSVLGDDLTAEFVYAGTTIYGLFTEVSVSSGSLTAYIAGPTDIEDVWAYINAYGQTNAATIEAADCAKDAIAPLLDKYYAKASLVMVPSLYKTSIVYSERPLTTDGQLAFTRSNDTATRVNSAGLIEKVRTNLVPNGLSFFAATGVLYTTVTSDSPISGVSSTRITKNEAAGTLRYANQSVSASVLTGSISYTISRYFKYDGYNLTTSMEFNNSGQWGGTSWVQTIDIASTGVTLQAQSNCTSKITNVGNGWYRVDVTVVTGASPSGSPVTHLLKVDSTLSTGQGFLTAAPQLETGDIATAYIATTTAAVSVGPVANLPRLNYPINSDGSVGCPSLLLEPQRTNLALYSEQLDNAAWTKTNATITANSIVSPDGNTNADLITTITTGDLVQQSFTLTSGTSYTGSFFLKAGTGTSIAILYSGAAFSAAQTVSFDLTTKQGTATSGTPTFTITDFGNGWLRCTITATATSTNTGNFRVASLSLDAVSTFYAWGAQLEEGAYATSYIPTLGASVTRGADACSKTGISSLIGQTEGTIFIDFKLNQAPSDVNGRLLQLWATNDTTNAIIPILNQSLQLQITMFGANVGSPIILAGPSTLLGLGQNKIAVAYTSTSVVVYRNGVLFASGNPTGFFPTSLTSLDLGGSSFATRNLGNPINQALLFKTRLPNSELASLTTL